MKTKFLILISILLMLSGLFLLLPGNSENTDIPIIEEVQYDPILSTQAILKVNLRLTQDTNIIEKTASSVLIGFDEVYYYALTNYHVVNFQDGYELSSFTVTDYLNNTYLAESYILNNPEEIVSGYYDLAMIRFPKNEINLEPVVMRDSQLTTADLLTSIGFDKGIKKHEIGYFTSLVKLSQFTFNILEHSCEITQGFSGGGIFDKNGKLVGINFGGVFTETNDFVTGYAIPTFRIKEYIKIFNINFTL